MQTVIGRTGLTFIFIFIAFLIKDKFVPPQVQPGFLLFYSAVMLSAWYGGFVQGLLATSLTALVMDYFYYTPGLFTMSAAEATRVLMFALDGLLVATIASVARAAKSRAEEALEIAQAAETASRANATRFRRVAESNMIGLMELRRTGEIIDCNEYLAHLLGYERDEILESELRWQDLTPPELLDQSKRAVDLMYQTGQLPPLEKEYYRKDGSRVAILIGASKLTEDRHVTFVLDMTEMKKAAQALADVNVQLEERVTERTKALIATADQLKQSQQFLDSVVENLPVTLFVKDAKDFHYVRMNRAGEELVGHKREVMINKNDFDFFPAGEAKSYREQDLAVIRQGSVIDFGEEELTTPKGIRYLHTRKIPIFGPDGKPQYVLGISEDIGERKVLERQRLTLMQEQAARVEAEKTAERMRFLSEASASLNESLELRSMLQSFAKVLVNHMADWCEIVLVSEGELKVEEIVIAHRDQKQLESVKELLNREEPVDFSQPRGTGHVIRTGEPELHSVIEEEFVDAHIKSSERKRLIKELGLNSAIIVPLQCYGRIIGAFSICSVRAESNRFYDQMDLSMVLDLAKRASFAIENLRLLRKAQEASQAKSAFLANMSHEIRTPLGAILGFAELLSEDQLTTEQKRYLETLNRNGHQLLRIVDEVLDLSKVESNQMRIENVPFSLSAQIDEIFTLLKPQAEDKGIDLKANLAKDLPESIVSDPTRMRQILINIIGNAIKFTPDGSVEARFEIHRRTAHPGRPILEISVTDTGIGVAKNQREQLFQPFVQADNSMTRRFGGTGLGLFLSRKLARMMGGDVVLGNTPNGKGSKFIITLEVGAEEAKVLEPAFPEKTETPAHERILVVDDAADNRTLMQLYLARFGFESDTADSGQQAVDMATKKKYSLILMDVQMPEMDGFEAVRELRQRKYQGPIVALTAHTMKGDRERCLEGGFDDYLGKPIDRQMLRQSLERFVQSSPASSM